MKKSLILSLLLFVLTKNSFAQNVGIGTTTPNPSALLEVNSTTRGLLAPRMTTAQRNAIATPAKGLLVYDTDVNSMFHYNGSSWANFSGSGNFSLPFAAAVNLNAPTFQIENAGSGDVLFLGASTGSAINAYNTGNSAAINVNATNGFGVYAQSFNSIPVFALNNNANNTLPAIRANNTGGGVGLDALSTTQSAIRATSNNQFASIEATNPHVSGIGVLGSSTSGIGVKGTSAGTGPTKPAVLGESSGNGGVGVLGSSASASGFGVYGLNSTGVALYGNSLGGTAIRGVSNTGYGLDVQGKIKISGGNTNPQNGAVLTSVDDNGNAIWKPGRIAFNAGGVATNHTTVPNGSARRVQFGIGEFYDLSQNYNLLTGAPGPTSSSFTAPVDGIYHFDMSVYLYSPWALNSEPQPQTGNLKLIRNSGGVVKEMAEAESLIEKGCCAGSMSFKLSRDIFLKAGDFVYVEVIQFNEEAATYTISPLPQTYFNGHIVIAL